MDNHIVERSGEAFWGGVEGFYVAPLIVILFTSAQNRNC